jgi:acyl carrier protein
LELVTLGRPQWSISFKDGWLVMSELTFLTKLAQILQLNEEALSEQVELNSENWDSLAIMATISAIDEEFDISVPTSHLVECTSVGDLLKLIRLNLKES